MQALQDRAQATVIGIMTVTTVIMVAPTITAVTAVISARIGTADVQGIFMKTHAALTARVDVWSCRVKPVVWCIAAIPTTPIAMCGIALPAPRTSL